MDVGGDSSSTGTPALYLIAVTAVLGHVDTSGRAFLRHFEEAFMCSSRGSARGGVDRGRKGREERVNMQNMRIVADAAPLPRVNVLAILPHVSLSADQQVANKVKIVMLLLFSREV